MGASAPMCAPSSVLGKKEGDGLSGCGVWVCILLVGFWVGDGRRWLDFDPVPIQAACRCPGVGGHLPPAIAMPPRSQVRACTPHRPRAIAKLPRTKQVRAAGHITPVSSTGQAQLPESSGSIGLPSKRHSHALPPERIGALGPPSTEVVGTRWGASPTLT